MIGFLIFIGFTALAILGFFAVAWAVVSLWFNLPLYNPIGGARNSNSARIGSIIYSIGVGLYWYWLFSYINFSVSIST